jgi:uncharacterized OB-fold protein
MSECAYEHTRRVVYGEDRFTFVPVCEKCGRYVKPDETITTRIVPGTETQWVPAVVPVTPNAACSKCGRTAMVWEGCE